MATDTATQTQRDDLATLPQEDVVTLAQGDGVKARRALEELVRRNQKKVYLGLYHLAPKRNDLDDLTQEVLLRMCRSIKSIRNPKTFKYWLNRIVTNLFYDQLRKKPRQLKTRSMDEPMRYDDDSTSGTRDIPDKSRMPQERMLGSELDHKIHQAIEELPEHFRTIVVLREIRGLSYDEIAQLTDTQLGTVKSRLARARGQLKEKLAPYLQAQGHDVTDNH